MSLLHLAVARTCGRVMLAALVVFACLALACGQQEPATVAHAEDVAVAIDRSIAVQRFDGPRRVLVTLDTSGGYPITPRWSPDGRSVAYVQRRFFVSAEADWGDDIYVVPVAPGAAPRLIRAHRERGQQVEGLAWTPDGRGLLLGETRVAGGDPFAAATSRILRIEIASEAERVLVEGGTDPSLSADGRRLTFLRDARTRPSLFVADADGARVAEVVSAGVFVVIRSPRIAPDGGSILFAAPAEGATAGPRAPLPTLARLLGARRAEAHGLPSYAWTVEVATGQRRRLTDFAMDDPAVAWGDGGRSAVILAADGLYRALPDGSAIQRAEGGAVGSVDAR